MPRAQKGFTLIEIIVVLVIIGILAVLAIPRYMDLTADAKNRAAYAALAEGMARVNQVAAQQILVGNGAIPTAGSVNALLTGSMTDAGDFSLTYAPSGSTAIAITASGISGNVSGGSISGTVRLPFTGN